MTIHRFQAGGVAEDVLGREKAYQEAFNKAISKILKARGGIDGLVIKSYRFGNYVHFFVAENDPEEVAAVVKRADEEWRRSWGMDSGEPRAN